MRIVKLWDSDYPWDVRVEKITSSLIERGHEVHLLCRNKGMQQPNEVLQGLHIHRLPLISKRRKVNEILSFPAFFSPFWIAHATRVVRRVKPHVILVRDLPLCLTAWFVGRLTGVPVVLDMAEDYPEQCKNVWKLKGFKLRNLFVRNPLLAEVVERISIRIVDHILVVIDESRERIVDLGADPRRITVVINTPAQGNSSTSPGGGIPDSVARNRDKLKLVYLGLLDENRGIQTIIGAIPLLKRKLNDFCVIIIGRGTHEGHLRKMAEDLDVLDAVIFEGWIDYSKAPDYISNCDIGVVPHKEIPGWHATIPNKLFDYMSFGKPVIVSNARAAARVVREEDCGVVFEGEGEEQFVQALLKLTDPATRKRMGRNGERAVKSRYNWSVDSARLVEALERTIRG